MVFACGFKKFPCLEDLNRVLILAGERSQQLPSINLAFDRDRFWIF